VCPRAKSSAKWTENRISVVVRRAKFEKIDVERFGLCVCCGGVGEKFNSTTTDNGSSPVWQMVPVRRCPGRPGGDAGRRPGGRPIIWRPSAQQQNEAAAHRFGGIVQQESPHVR